MESAAPLLSVVVPALHEAATIGPALERLAALPAPWPVEILVVDGDPARRDTLAAAARPGVRTLASPPGRGRQMNAGAAAARGQALLFLHADTTLPETAFARVAEVLDEPALAGGAFGLGFASPRLALRLLARAGDLRNRLTRTPYGDQAIFLRRSAFEALGGFADIPIMEDVDLMRRAKARGMRIRILPERVATSPRRYEAEGLLRAVLRNALLRLRFALGADPARLARLYPPRVPGDRP
ncbi:MAG: TIGR04283 family arsenosugar biosynthesis glycosyltransferase [Thermodesulfobacteriota bacterium]